MAEEWGQSGAEGMQRGRGGHAIWWAGACLCRYGCSSKWKGGGVRVANGRGRFGATLRFCDCVCLVLGEGGGAQRRKGAMVGRLWFCSRASETRSEAVSRDDGRWGEGTGETPVAHG